MAAGALVLTEAGGKVTKGDGSPFNVFAKSIIASNTHLHEQARCGRSLGRALCDLALCNGEWERLPAGSGKCRNRVPARFCALERTCYMTGRRFASS